MNDLTIDRFDEAIRHVSDILRVQAGNSPDRTKEILKHTLAVADEKKRVGRLGRVWA